MPKAHSGEGIFFTSKVADVFVLESFDYKLQVDNLLEDVFVAKINDQLEGTKVIFRIKKDTDKKLENIFKDYQAVETEFGFDKTEITVKLYENDINYVSRSQARRILVGLDKFKKIILDFKDISGIGQAFADEIFRVFKERHPDITIEFKNTNEAIEMMIKRVK
jgi:virulence-associated protein VapD